jgi:hypothetical protein
LDLCEVIADDWRRYGDASQFGARYRRPGPSPYGIDLIEQLFRSGIWPAVRPAVADLARKGSKSREGKRIALKRPT